MVRKIWMLAAAVLTLALGQTPALAQYGPPASGNTSAIEFVPAIVERVAGLNGNGYTGDNGPATAATLKYPVGIAYDSNGNLYIADSDNYVIRKVDISGTITTVAGNNTFPDPYSLTAPPANTQATAWSIGATAGMAIDSNNNFYFSDTTYNVIWKVDVATGVITVFAGTPGTAGYTGNNGLATSATLDVPLGLAFDSIGNLYVSDFINHVVRVIGTDGKINTFAGDGSGAGNQDACPALSGLGGLATTVGLCYPEGIATDTAGNVYIADYYDNIVLIVGSNGKINAFAGTGAFPGSSSPTYSGDGGPATAAELWRPYGVYWTSGGVLFIADQFGQLVRQVDASGNIHTVYGDTYGGEFTKALLGLPDTEPNAANAGFADGIEYISMDPYGNLITADGSGSAILTAGSTGGYTFPETNVYYTSSPYYLVVFNPSGVPLKFTDAPPVITGPFAITTGATAGTCVLSSAGSLAPGASCTIGLTFSPTLDQKYTGSVVFTSNANSSPNTITLFGTGDGSPTYSGTITQSLTFTSTVGVTTASMTATFTNTGNAPLTVAANNPPIVGANTAAQEFALSGTDCPASLAAGGVCHFYVTFDPTAVTPEFQPDTARLEVAVSNFGDVFTNLSGSAMPAAAPAASLSPGALNFGGVQIDTTSDPLIETVTNTGGGTLNISGVSTTQTGDTVFFIGTGANQCTNTTALAAGQSCNVYVTFKPALSGQTSTGTLNIADNAPPSPQTATLTGVGDYFYEPINTSSGSEPVSVYFTTPGTLSGINVVTEGSGYLDFGNGSGGTCSAGTAYTVGQLCTVDVVFTPQYSGARNGSVYLTDAAGNVLGSTFLAGWGDGPELVFTPATPAAITGTIAGLNSVAVDGAANLYYVDGSGNVSMLAWTGSSYNAATVIANIFTAIGSQYANCIAIDASGNLYVGANSHLEKIPATGPGKWGTPIALNIPGGVNVFQIGVDGAGNLYFSDPVHQRVDEMTWNGSQYGSPTSVPFAASNTVIPWGVAVDSTGDVFTLGTVDASGATEVLELPVNGSGYGSVVTVPLPTIAGPSYLALDGDDNLYVTGLGVSATGDVLLVPYSNNAYGTPISISPGTSFGYLQLTVDGAGNVYAVNQPTSTQFEDEIVQFSLPTPSALTFNLTSVGSTSSDSPRTVAAINIGNEDVYFNSISYPGDFPEDGTASQQCNNEFPLDPGATCGVSIDFTPTRDGYITEYVTLKDNDLDDSNDSQSISVSGTGTAASTAPAVTLSPPSLTFSVPTGNTSNVAVSTLTNTGTAPLTITKTSLTGANPGSFIETDNCVARSPIPINGICSISVQFVATIAGPFSAAVSFVDNAANTPQSLPLNATATSGAPIVTLTPALAFPVTPVGQGNQLMATLANTGNAPLTNIAVSITGANAYMFNIYPNGSCSGKTTLPQDSACTISVDFYPPGPGSFEAVLTVTDNAAGSPQTSILTGSGTQPELQFTPGQFNFLAGTPGMLGDTGSGPAISALIGGGYGIALDSTGLVYFSDYDFNTVWQIDGNGNINVYAGIPVEAPGHGSYSGDNGPAASATLNAPQQIAFDPSGNLYIDDRFNNLIRMVNSAGTITTFAGSYGNGFGGYAGDGGPANQATLNNPQGVTADPQGNVYIADTNNNVVRKVDTTGTITLFAGTPGVSGNSGDGGPATSATLGQIYQLATDLNGNLYIADFGNGVVRKVDSDGTISTYAGGGTAAVTTTPQPATSVNLNNGPVGLVTDPAGNLYVLGLGHTNLPGVFLVNTSQQISQIVGGGATLVSGAPANAENTNLNAIAVDAMGDLYVNDAFDHVVSEIDPNGDLAFPSTAINTVSAPLTVILSNTGNAPLSFSDQYDDDVVRKQRHPAPARARAAAHTARPDVVDFNSYGTIAGPFAIASGGTCNFDDGIAPGDSCTMNVTFNPTATGAATGTITLFTDLGNDSANPNTILLTGTGTQAGIPGATLTPSQSFPNTITGTTSSVLAATLSNTGTGTLTITSIAIGGANPGDFAVSTGSNACGTTLAAGATCNIYVTFTPGSVAAFSATLTVTDNANPTTQSITLTGTGVPQTPQVIDFTQPASVTYSPTLTVSLVATGGASGNPVVFTIDASSTAAGSISGNTLTITGVGNFVIDANQAGNSTYAAAPQVQKSFVVSQAPQAINFTQPATPVVFSSGLTIALTATGGASGSAVVFTLDSSSTAAGSISGNTLTVTSAGNLVIDANQAGNADYSAAPQVQRTVLVSPPPPNFAITAAPPSQTIAPGASAAYTVAIAATNGTFNNVVTLSAAGLPAGANGTFAPATINPGNGNGTSTFTVQLAPALQASARGSSWPLATPALALLFLIPFRRWRKAWRGKLLLLVAGLVSLAGVVNLTACGGGFLLGSVAQTYTITITGAGGADSHSTTVQLTVK